MLEINELTIDKKDLFNSYLGGKYKNSFSSFANIFIWRDYYETKYSIVDDFLVLFYQSKSGKIHPSFPYGVGDITSVIEKVGDFLSSIDQKFTMKMVCESDAEKLKVILGDKIIINEERDLFDYVYLKDDLSTLSGKKLHSKRNHINKFKSLYNYEYRPISEDMYDLCIEKTRQWLLKNKYSETDSSFVGEMLSINEAFKHFDEFEFSGGSIFVDDELIAYSIGEQLTEDTALIHIEKADIDYEGSFAMINNEFVKNRWQNCTYINREEDMGIEGLRKAKLSYKPYELLKVYNCEISL